MRIIPTLSISRQGIFYGPIIAYVCCQLYFFPVVFLRLIIQTDKRNALTTKLSRSGYSIQFDISDDENTFRRLPVYLEANTEHNKGGSGNFQVFDYKDYSDIPHNGPFPYKPFGPWRMYCNPDFSLDRLLKGNEILLRDNLYDKSWSQDISNWQFVLSYYNVRYGRINRLQPIVNKLLGASSLRELEYCLFHDLTIFNLTENGDNDAIRLNRLGLIHDNQEKSYIWNNNNKTSISRSSLPDNLSDLIDCDNNECYTHKLSDEEIKCKCTYKSGIVDILNTVELFKDSLKLEFLGANLPFLFAMVLGQFIFLMMMGGTNFYGLRLTGIGYYLFHRYVSVSVGVFLLSKCLFINVNFRNVWADLKGW
jgi:hypothetical protein